MCLSRNAHSNVSSLVHTFTPLPTQPLFDYLSLPRQGVVKLHGGLVKAEAARGVESTVVGDVA